MRIVLLSEWFPKDMGYMNVMLPKYLVKLGAEVHVLTLDVHFYQNNPDFGQTYLNYQQAKVKKGFIKEEFEGYTIYTLPYKKVFGYYKMVGMPQMFKLLKPDIVYSFIFMGLLTFEAALLKPFFNYKLFAGSHTTISVFPLAQRGKVGLFDKQYLRNLLTKFIPGRIMSLFIEKCYGATLDCSEIAVKYYGVPKAKIDTKTLGVDTTIFYPITTDEDVLQRKTVRESLEIKDDEVVCIYTGRFSKDKNPLLLAKAIESLIKKGLKVRGLFIGNGIQLEDIKKCMGCIVHPFVPFKELAKFYRASEIGVWPTQESTSMLDAAACGIPIIVNDTLIAIERVEGNGLTYKLNDVESLKEKIEELYNNKELRERLGKAGAIKMREKYNWEKLVEERYNDFLSSLK